MSWSIYLLSNGTRTYIGSTTDPHRRLRQHNGEIKGGARSTSRTPGQWKLVLYLSGFANRSEACRWERILKCRARGLGPRYLALTNLALGLCPAKGRLPHYQPPENLVCTLGEMTMLTGMELVKPPTT